MIILEILLFSIVVALVLIIITFLPIGIMSLLMLGKMVIIDFYEEFLEPIIDKIKYR